MAVFVYDSLKVLYNFPSLYFLNVTFSRSRFNLWRNSFEINSWNFFRAEKPFSDYKRKVDIFNRKMIQNLCENERNNMNLIIHVVKWSGFATANME